MDDNLLTIVPDLNTFRAMPALTELYIEMNSLKYIPSESFSVLKYLTRLDLKGSGLYNISFDSYKGLEALKALNLADYRLHSIPSLG